jgi:hypothetical protein
VVIKWSFQVINIPDAQFIPSSGIEFSEGRIQYRLTNDYGYISCTARVHLSYVYLQDTHVGADPKEAFEKAKAGIWRKAGILEKELQALFAVGV